MKNELQSLVDRRLSGLTWSPDKRHLVTQTLKGGQKVVKRKISTVLIFSLMLVMIAMTALAISLSNVTFEKVIEIEAAEGDFSKWSLDEKLQLIAVLQEGGYGLSDDSLAELSQTGLSRYDKEKLADKIITEEFGTIATHIDIIEKVKGPMSTWSLEDKAWYTNYMHEAGLLFDSTQDLLPGPGDLAREEAVQIAKTAVMEAYGLTDADMAILFADVSFFACDEADAPRWLVNFGEYPYPNKYVVLLTREGEVTEDATMGILTPKDAAVLERTTPAPSPVEIMEQTKGPHETWSLEDKAQYLGGNNGLPKEDEIPSDEALQIAEKAISGVLAHPRSTYTACVWYLLKDDFATDAFLQKPFYVIYFTDNLEAPLENYSVTIDPQTGEILRIHTPASGSHG